MAKIRINGQTIELEEKNGVYQYSFTARSQNIDLYHLGCLGDTVISDINLSELNDSFTTNPEGAEYIGIAVTESNTPPANKDEYTWTLIKGADGADGKDGKDGIDGKDGTVDYDYLIANGYVSYSANPPSDTTRLWVDSNSYPRVMYYYDPNMELSSGQTSRDRWIPLDNQITQQMTNLEQTINEFNFSFTSVSEFQDEQSNTSVRFAEINKYIRFIDGKVHISEDGNPFNIIISNDRISFMNNDMEIAYCKGDEFYVDKLQALTKLTVGNIEITNITSTVAGIVIV